MCGGCFAQWSLRLNTALRPCRTLHMFYLYWQRRSASLERFVSITIAFPFERICLLKRSACKSLQHYEGCEEKGGAINYCVTLVTCTLGSILMPGLIFSTIYMSIALKQYNRFRDTIFLAEIAVVTTAIGIAVMVVFLRFERTLHILVFPRSAPQLR